MSDPSITTDSASGPTPEAIAALNTPDPVKIAPREAPKEEAKKPSLRESMDAAKAKLEAKEKAEADPKALKTAPKEAPTKVDPKAATEAKAKADAETAAKAKPVDPKERARGEHGHFTADPSKSDAENETARVAAEKAAAPAKAADPTDHKQPLQRFSQAAKERWADVPEEAQKEIHRAFREVEAGLTKHREGSTRYSEVFKEFDDLAKSSNVDSKATLQSYVTIDKALHSGDARQIVGAINQVFKAAGVDPKQYAQAILGGQQREPANDRQQQAQPSAREQALERKIADLERKFGGVEQHIQGEVKSKHEQTLTDWSADKPHFAQLRSEVTRLVKDEGLSPDDAYASALVTAQDQARAFLGDSAVKPSSRTVLDDAADELAEQIDKGSKSIKGAASAGSTPPRSKGPLPSIKESMRKAAQRLA